MKLKAIFVIFNVLIGVSFLFVFLMPAFFLGWDYTQLFWRDNWYLALLFVAVLAILNGYFVANWRLFNALESEDWDAVILVLEQRTLARGRFSASAIRLLVNAYVVTGHPEKIETLEAHLREHHPRRVARHAMILGIPHLLSNDGADMEAYYGEMLEQVRGTEADWVRWSYAFALMLQQKFAEASTTLTTLVEKLKPGVLLGLSAYLLDAYSRTDDGVNAAVADARKRITASISRREWQKQVDRERGELYVLVLTRLLHDVTTWLYGAEEREAQP